MCVSMMQPIRAESSLHVGCAIYLRVLEGVSSGFTSGLTCLVRYVFFLSAPARSVSREQGKEFLSLAPWNSATS